MKIVNTDVDKFIYIKPHKYQHLAGCKCYAVANILFKDP